MFNSSFAKNLKNIPQFKEEVLDHYWNSLDNNLKLKIFEQCHEEYLNIMHMENNQYKKQN